MTNYAIQVQNLGKEYIIGGAEQRHDSFREMVTGAMVAPFRKMRKLGGTAREEERFWALKDVSFNVKQGEVLGIIGRNGAGKSTLLKLLSRITSPTEGQIITRGRVASLLEVGTGFHPELTGRENIYLNGAILGMSKAEIGKSFDQIVSFAEIDKFLDTPVKRYSSGMYIRLAFSVAAHLDSDILIVDEVLAVGDDKFQKKCLGQMRDISSEGRTVLFVSHNMTAINTLCTSCALLDQGKLQQTGKTHDVVSAYLESANDESLYCSNDVIGDSPKIVRAELQDRESSLRSEEIRLSVFVRSKKSLDVSLDFRITDNFGANVGFGSLGRFSPNHMITLRPGTTQVEVGIPTEKLAIGAYRLGLDLANPKVEYYDRVDDCLLLTVDPRKAQDGVEALQQQWGLGCMEFNVQELRVEYENFERE